MTGQALDWDGAVSSLNQLACSTNDLRHLWDLRWEDWQNCLEHAEWHAELMDQFMQNLDASPAVRGGLLVERAEERGLKVTTGYLHSSIGLTAAGDLILLMKTGSLLEIAAAQRRLGAERAILLDNGGSVGAAYWSRFAWQRSGWPAICERRWPKVKTSGFRSSPGLMTGGYRIRSGIRIDSSYAKRRSTLRPCSP